MMLERRYSLVRRREKRYATYLFIKIKAGMVCILAWPDWAWRSLR